MTANLENVLLKLEKKSKRERLGKASMSKKNMMLAITYETGLFFNIILKVMKANRVLEIGTSTGYSTLWFVDALLHNMTSNRNSKLFSSKPLITIENDPMKIKKASKNFSDAGVIDKIDIML